MKAKTKHSKLIIGLSLLFSFSVQAQEYKSKVWQADNGNGIYNNPVIHADYSDPDVIRVGEDYYMTASSFNAMPGLPILHSKDMVNWQIVNYALQKQVPTYIYNKPQHGNGVWAPSIRFHNGEFYIYWGDPDFGIYMVKTKDPKGTWSEPVLVKSAKGYIDSCPFWDEDGNAYIVHALAGTRAGFKSVLLLTKMTADGTKTIGESKIIYDGHLVNKTIEGPKMYKKDGYYYILAPAGGVATGWQLAMRSKNIWGPYEEKRVMEQGKSNVNGPHQGAWVTTPKGEDWFYHFQDKGVFGRVVHLNPMKWKDGWPVIGTDIDGDGCGEPVSAYKKPDVGREYPINTPVEDDDFSANALGLQWQWQANPSPLWYFTNAAEGSLRLYSVFTDSIYSFNLYDVPNILLQKFPAEEFMATTKITFSPTTAYKGERVGLVIMGQAYGLISLENTEKGITIFQVDSKKAHEGQLELANQSIIVDQKIVYFRVKVSRAGIAKFYYSLDNLTYQNLGNEFKIVQGKWIGAKVGLVCQRPKWSNDGGWADIDWFKIEKYVEDPIITE